MPLNNLLNDPRSNFSNYDDHTLVNQIIWDKIIIFKLESFILDNRGEDERTNRIVRVEQLANLEKNNIH